MFKQTRVFNGERHTMSILTRLMGLALTGLLATACSSATVKESWIKPGYSDKVENVYLIGIAKENDFRRVFEEAFKRELSDKGVRAVPSHNLLPQSQEGNREVIIQSMAANGCDSVLLTRLIRSRKEVDTPGPGIQAVKVTPSPLYLDPWYNSWGGYYSRNYSVINIQPEAHETVTLTLESVLYSLEPEERIWSAQLEIVDAIDIKNMIQDYVEEVAKNLRQKGLI